MIEFAPFIAETADYLRSKAALQGWQDDSGRYHPGAIVDEEKTARLESAADSMTGPLRKLLKQADKLLELECADQLPAEAGEEVVRLREALSTALVARYRLAEIAATEAARAPTLRDPRRRNHYLHRSAIRLAMAAHGRTHPRQVRRIAAAAMERAGIELASETSVNVWIREEREALALWENQQHCAK